MGALLLASQGLFLGAFLVRVLTGGRPAAADAPRAQASHAVTGARALVLFHAVGMALVSAGITGRFIARRVPSFASLRALVGLAIVFAASVVVIWALQVFASWRLLARLDAGHALCTEGPYRLVRHPIYLAIDLWALGTAVALPGVATLVGAAVTFAGSDLRARAEERLLAEVFGDRYRVYAARVRRLLPGLY